MNNQQRQIVSYMERFGSITPMQAIDHLGITKLSTRVGELKQQGYDIAQAYESSYNRFGRKCRYMRYWLRRN